MSEQRSWAFWCARVLGHVRFKPDRKAIERELTAHYEDHRLDLERIGYEPALAAERARRNWPRALTVMSWVPMPGPTATAL